MNVSAAWETEESKSWATGILNDIFVYMAY